MKSIGFPKLIPQHLFLFLSTILSYASQAQLVQLPNQWKFKIGDNIDWAQQSFNDTHWENKQLGIRWAATGMKESVYAWYRIKLIIPSSLKSEAETNKGIKLNLGKINEVDQTFFNGKLIGHTGSFPPAFESIWDAERVYIISASEVQWDKENIIAVRVFSSDIEKVGMYQGPYTFRPIQWSDSISIQDSISGTENNGFTTRITLTNKCNNTFKGIVKYWIADKTGKEVYSETKLIQVNPELGSESVVTFANFQSSIETIFKVRYQVTENSSSVTIQNEQLYLANKNIEIEVANEPMPVVENKIRNVFTSIPFQNQILGGYIGNRFTQNLEERLLKVDETRMIEGYLQRPGDHPWYGEHVGKYLETACNAWKNTHDVRLKKQMDRMMFVLINSQLEDGYLGTYTPDIYWTSWDVWSHKYNLYGLLAYYAATGYQPALEACKRMGDLLCKTFGNKAGQRDIILAGEHIGMAATSVLDPIVELYRYTGEKKYLDFCYYILDAWEKENGPKIISSLLSTGKVDKVANGKAYEMLSNLVGLIKLYRVTGDAKFLNPVLIAWKDIVTNRLYITGTTSSHEHFQGDDILPAADKDNIGEGCVTVTWIQLNQILLDITGELKFVEQIEKSVYNQLLGAENPESGCISYFTPLMGTKRFTCDITCCTSSVPRGIAMIPYFTFGSVKNVPTLMLYESASYKENITIGNKKNITLSVKIESNFPEDGDVIVTVNTSQIASFPLAFRVPSWSSSFIAKVAGQEYKGTASQYLIIKRIWKSGDKIKISFKIPIQILHGGKSYPGQIAFQRGPHVLAFDNSLNIELQKKYQFESNKMLFVEKPGGKNNEMALPGRWIGKQAYTVNIISNKNNVSKQQLIMVPFADAGQTGGFIKVWMPFKVTNQ